MKHIKTAEIDNLKKENSKKDSKVYNKRNKNNELQPDLPELTMFKNENPDCFFEVRNL